jgi:hypothetical protein
LCSLAKRWEKNCQMHTGKLLTWIVLYVYTLSGNNALMLQARVLLLSTVFVSYSGRWVQLNLPQRLFAPDMYEISLIINFCLSILSPPALFLQHCWFIMYYNHTTKFFIQIYLVEFLQKMELLYLQFLASKEKYHLFADIYW